jgi:hypothetical protein
VLGVTKSSIGQGQDPEKAKQEDVEKVKAAVSDALKRCAVHFGIGRFLYLPAHSLRHARPTIETE